MVYFNESKEFFFYYSNLGYATDYDKKNCRVIINKRLCKLSVVRKDNQNVGCPHRGVGR